MPRKPKDIPPQIADDPNERERWGWRNLLLDFDENAEQSPLVERVNRLPQDERTLLLKWLFHGSYSELARRYSCSPAWLAKRIRGIVVKLGIERLEIPNKYRKNDL